MEVTINHPAFGTVYLRDCYVRNGYVVGVTSVTRDTMNFPISCIRLTKRPPDAGESAASSDSLPASALSASEGDT